MAPSLLWSIGMLSILVSAFSSIPLAHGLEEGKSSLQFGVARVLMNSSKLKDGENAFHDTQVHLVQVSAGERDLKAFPQRKVSFEMLENHVAMIERFGFQEGGHVDLDVRADGGTVKPTTAFGVVLCPREGFGSLGTYTFPYLREEEMCETLMKEVMGCEIIPPKQDGGNLVVEMHGKLMNQGSFLLGLMLCNLRESGIAKVEMNYTFSNPGPVYLGADDLSKLDAITIVLLIYATLLTVWIVYTCFKYFERDVSLQGQIGAVLVCRACFWLFEWSNLHFEARGVLISENIHSIVSSLLEILWLSSLIEICLLISAGWKITRTRLMPSEKSRIYSLLALQFVLSCLVAIYYHTWGSEQLSIFNAMSLLGFAIAASLGFVQLTICYCAWTYLRCNVDVLNAYIQMSSIRESEFGNAESIQSKTIRQTRDMLVRFRTAVLILAIFKISLSLFFIAESAILIYIDQTTEVCFYLELCTIFRARSLPMVFGTSHENSGAENRPSSTSSNQSHDPRRVVPTPPSLLNREPDQKNNNLKAETDSSAVLVGIINPGESKPSAIAIQQV